MKNIGAHIIIVASMLLLLASCGSGRKSVARGPGKGASTEVKERHKPQRHNGDPGFNVDSGLAEKIVKSARKWIGTPYRYGGKDRKGTDCSGMTMTLFSDVAGVDIPRNSGKQYEYCVSIGHEDLQPGDLVFFSSKAGGGNVSHVGIYVGERKMIHASASKGVMESCLDEKYWLDHYYGSGRVSGVTYAMTGRKPARERRKNKPRQAVERRPEPVLSVPASKLPVVPSVGVGEDEMPQIDAVRPADVQSNVVPDNEVPAEIPVSQEPAAGDIERQQPAGVEAGEKDADGNDSDVPTEAEISAEVEAAFSF